MIADVYDARRCVVWLEREREKKTQVIEKDGLQGGDDNSSVASSVHIEITLKYYNDNVLLKAV